MSWLLLRNAEPMLCSVHTCQGVVQSQRTIGTSYRTNHGAKNSTRINDSGLTVDSKVSWVTLMTSEAFSASVSATTRDAKPTAEAAETSEVKRIAGEKCGGKKLERHCTAFMDETCIRVNFSTATKVKTTEPGHQQ